MAVDDSFKRPGTIPFKWEIRPGVPKSHGSDHLQYKNHDDPFVHKEEEQDKSPQPRINHSRPDLHTPMMLRPPPAGRLYYQPTPELRTRSFRSAPRTKSERHRFELSVGVGSGGCFPSPLLKRVTATRRSPKTLLELDYCSDLETLPRWSASSRKSVSPFSDSTVSSPFSSNESSSPRPVSDAEWAGFALF